MPSYGGLEVELVGRAVRTTAVLEEDAAAGLLALTVEAGLLALEVVEVVDLGGLLLVVVDGRLVLEVVEEVVLQLQGEVLNVLFLSAKKNYLACMARSPVDPVEEVGVARTPLLGPGPDVLQNEKRIKQVVLSSVSDS